MTPGADPAWLADIAGYMPRNEQEQSDQAATLWYAREFPDTILLRDNALAHITSSGLILSPGLDRVLLVHHNIRGCWGWTGGHADGDMDLLSVAIREAAEETGITRATPLTGRIASIDVLPVYGHMRRGRYVSAHLHLSVAYLLIANERDALHVKPDENSGVRWFHIADIRQPMFDRFDTALYRKLIDRARE